MLIIIGFAAGLIAGISPCILPLLPGVFMAGAASRDAAEGVHSWRRPPAIVVGLVVSFSLLVLAGSCPRALPHVEEWFRRYAPDGLVVVGVHTPCSPSSTSSGT